MLLFLLYVICTTYGKVANFSQTTVPASPQRFSMDVRQEVCLKLHCNESLLKVTPVPHVYSVRKGHVIVLTIIPTTSLAAMALHHLF